MWGTETFWFDIALVFGVFTLGNILLGHFEEHKPKWRRLLKVMIILGIALCLSYYQLRWAFYVILVVFGVAAAYIHLVWLPKNGINGWTGQPREKYLVLLGVKQPKERAGCEAPDSKPSDRSR